MYLLDNMTQVFSDLIIISHQLKALLIDHVDSSITSIHSHDCITFQDNAMSVDRFYLHNRGEDISSRTRWVCSEVNPGSLVDPGVD